MKVSVWFLFKRFCLNFVYSLFLLNYLFLTKRFYVKAYMVLDIFLEDYNISIYIVCKKTYFHRQGGVTGGTIWKILALPTSLCKCVRCAFMIKLLTHNQPTRDQKRN